MTGVTAAAVLAFAAAAGRNSSVSLLVHHVAGLEPPANLCLIDAVQSPVTAACMQLDVSECCCRAIDADLLVGGC